MKAQKKVRVDLSENFRIFETDIFREDLGELQPSIKDKIELKLRNSSYPALKLQPYFGKNIKKLTNYTPETWRFRVGNFRIFYGINPNTKIISMLTISARKDAY